MVSIVRKVTHTALILALAAGCVTGGSSVDEPEGVAVVERSKEQPPSWIELESGRLHLSGEDLRFVEARTHLRDLPLGLKQAQLGALESSKLAIEKRVLDELNSLAQAHGLSVGTGAAELERQLG